MNNAVISSRTPEGQPIRSPLCGKQVVIEPSALFGDAPARTVVSVLADRMEFHCVLISVNPVFAWVIEVKLAQVKLPRFHRDELTKI